MSCVLWLANPMENAAFFTHTPPPSATGLSKMRFLSSKFKGAVPVKASSAAAAGLATRSSEERVYEVVVKQAALVRRPEERIVKKKEEESKGVDDLKRGESDGLSSNWDLLNQAYDRCGQVCAEYAKTFYLGTLLMTLERRKAVWAIYGMVIAGNYC